ncbi:MAG: hypothetical protein HKP55_08375 [Gammaproteobacteria bacterium]|nr:hypothetical protein [Gammaproteobacteria bacterium]
MKKIIVSVALIFLAASSTTFASDYMNQEQREAKFCGKTFNGKNEISGWTYKVHVDASCKNKKIQYVTGKKAGKTFDRKITKIDPNGEWCRLTNRGQQRCNKMKDMGDGTYQGTSTFGKWKGKHYVTLSKIVIDEQL